MISIRATLFKKGYPSDLVRGMGMGIGMGIGMEIGMEMELEMGMEKKMNGNGNERVRSFEKKHFNGEF